jgi:hypothetical protein
MKKKEDIEGPPQLEAPRQDLQTYLTLKPTVNFEIERKLQELHVLVNKHWELKAIRVVEKIPTFSGDIKEKPVKHWMRAEHESDAKLKLKLSKKEAIPDVDPMETGSTRFAFAVWTCQEKVFAHYKDDEKALITKLFDSYLEQGYIRKLEEHEKRDTDAF